MLRLDPHLRAPSPRSRTPVLRRPLQRSPPTPGPRSPSPRHPASPARRSHSRVRAQAQTPPKRPTRRPHPRIQPRCMTAPGLDTPQVLHPPRAPTIRSSTSQQETAGLAPESSFDTPQATYGENFERLPALKRTYDPGNLFRLNQNIDPA